MHPLRHEMSKAAAVRPRKLLNAAAVREQNGVADCAGGEGRGDSFRRPVAFPAPKPSAALILPPPPRPSLDAQLARFHAEFAVSRPVGIQLNSSTSHIAKHSCCTAYCYFILSSKAQKPPILPTEC